LLDLFLPNEQVNSIFDLTPKKLLENNIKGIIVDLDNTLVPWNIAKPTDEVISWLKNMKASKIQVIIFSNNNAERVSTFVSNLEVKHVPKAKKPLSKQFKLAQKEMALSEGEIAVVGDQLLTDILGGNRVGFYTILVEPIVESDAAITKFNRNTERLILNHFYRKGKLIRGRSHE